MHELPQLGKLERKYRRELVILGVESPKYPAEAIPQNLAHAVARYEVEHPVVEDPDLVVWDSYAVNAWPTLIFVSPTGEVIGKHAGEATFEALDEVIAGLIQEYERDGSLSREPLELAVRKEQRPWDQLAYPGKVLVTEDTIYVADSGHNRIVVADREGQARQVIGSGEAGFEDGNVHQARFHRPQGMAYDHRGHTLYVADSENHAIRAVDLQQGRVSSVAGTGNQARSAVRSGPALQTALSSPWDVALDEAGSLFIAMAGTHQIWLLEGDSVQVWAGTGHEALRDGSRHSAWLAQPMGLSLRNGTLYVACAEAQAVRRIEVASGEVETMVGQGLFEFGDQDGPATTARLQHNQDVASAGDSVFIADTYNNKIKRIDETTSETHTYAGSGLPGVLDGPGENARFDEPAGLTLFGETLYIADTNNHLVRSIDLGSGHVNTLSIIGLDSTKGGA